MAAPPLAVSVLSAAQRRKLDESDDALFYGQPRFVQHLDGAFRTRLTNLYREHLRPEWRVRFRIGEAIPVDAGRRARGEDSLMQTLRERMLGLLGVQDWWPPEPVESVEETE